MKVIIYCMETSYNYIYAENHHNHIQLHARKFVKMIISSKKSAPPKRSATFGII